MLEFAEIIKLLVGIGTISSIIAGGAVYYTRKNTEIAIRSTKENQKLQINQITHTINNLEYIVSQNTKDTREDFNNLVVHIDDRIDKIYTRLESNTNEIKEYVTKEVSSLRAKDYDQDVKIEHTKDKLHSLETDLYKYKLEASEKYQKKEGS